MGLDPTLQHAQGIEPFAKAMSALVHGAGQGEPRLGSTGRRVEKPIRQAWPGGPGAPPKTLLLLGVRWVHLEADAPFGLSSMYPMPWMVRKPSAGSL